MEHKMIDSGVPWIGDVPVNWHTKRVADILIEINERGTGSEPVLSASQTMGVVQQHKLPQRAMSSDENKRENFKVVNPGQFVVSLRTFEGGIEHAWDYGIISPAYSVCSLINGDKGYYRHLFKSSGFIENLKQFMKGIRDGQSIPFSTLRTVIIPTPPLKEQQLISSYLDYHTSLIDRERDLITKKIALLREKRSALIYELVTGKRTIVEAQALAGDGGERLDDVVFAGQWAAVPTAKAGDPLMKNGGLMDSGVSWIGEAPDNWEMATLKSFTTISSGNGISADLVEPNPTNETPFPVFGSNGVRGYTSSHTHSGSYWLIGRQGSLSGAINEAVGLFFPSEHALVVTPDRICNHAWLGYLLKAANFHQYIGGAALPGLAAGFLSAIPMPLPSLKTQIKIGGFLDHSTRWIDREIFLLESKSDLLSDKRKALIFEAVTGKIDLRDTANT